MECHDTETKKGGLDLSSLKFDPASPANFEEWVKVYDKVKADEMPPPKKPRPAAGGTGGVVRCPCFPRS